MLTIDFHTHCFPDAIAGSTLQTLSACSGVVPYYDGTAAGLRAAARNNGVDYCVVQSIATNERQQRKVNDFAASLNRTDRLISFGSVYPSSPDAFEELDRIKALGLAGIKLHPDYQNFYVDDEALFPLYRYMAKLGFITVFHAGTDIGIPGPVRCTPKRLAAALPAFNGAPVVAAHLGGYLCWTEVETYLTGSDCYLDTSYTCGRIPYPQARRLIEKHGTDRILFGSDMPWSDMGMERRFISMLRLTDAEVEQVLGGNAERLLGIRS